MRHKELYRSVDQIIEDANFDENDLDLATTGLCGTFALSLSYDGRYFVYWRNKLLGIK